MLKRLLAVALSMGVSATAGAQASSPGSQPIVDRLLACRSVTVPAARLECFDRESKGLSGAIQRRDLALIDRDDLERSRRTMFGFTSPDHKMMERAIRRPAAAPLNHDGVVRSVSALTFGHYAITLADGAVWRNVDLLDSSPPVGVPVHIDRTPFGAYLLKMPNFTGVHAVRMR